MAHPGAAVRPGSGLSFRTGAAGTKVHEPGSSPLIRFATSDGGQLSAFRAFHGVFTPTAIAELFEKVLIEVEYGYNPASRVVAEPQFHGRKPVRPLWAPCCRRQAMLQSNEKKYETQQSK
mmetsp:Transcript_93857/g.155078  ORF Transcript_93857/g.155078 Transcript_93857/m.155078 type:complete len:120 (-) Transcript_93857:6-365(-)